MLTTYLNSIYLNAFERQRFNPMISLEMQVLLSMRSECFEYFVNHELNVLALIVLIRMNAI